MTQTLVNAIVSGGGLNPSVDPRHPDEHTQALTRLHDDITRRPEPSPDLSKAHNIVSTTTRRLAERFRDFLIRDLGVAEFERALNANHTRADGVCHFHDKCDANQTMIDAYKDVMGVDIDLNDDRIVLAWNIVGEYPKEPPTQGPLDDATPSTILWMASSLLEQGESIEDVRLFLETQATRFNKPATPDEDDYVEARRLAVRRVVAKKMECWSAVTDAEKVCGFDISEDAIEQIAVGCDDTHAAFSADVDEICDLCKCDECDIVMDVDKVTADGRCFDCHDKVKAERDGAYDAERWQGATS